jgi:protein phosphatase
MRLRWRRREQPRLGLRAATRSHLGLVRDQNQDACLAAPEQGLFAIADGMGGHQAGDVAARLTVEYLPELVERERERGRGDTRAALERAVIAVSDLVHAEAATDPGLHGMGTTLVLALLAGPTAYIAHVGDSRAYLLRAGGLRRLTEDHCYAAELVRAGVLGRAEARAHPLGHGLTRAIGMADVRPEVRRLRIARDDRLLLCSDGLTKMLPDARIHTLLASCHDPERACELLIDAANAAGGHDNVSAAVIDVLLPGAVGGADDEPVADPRDGLEQP